MLKRLLQAALPNPLDQILKKALRNEQTRFLIVWNRGLGDIPLGLYALSYRIRSMIPGADVTFATREELQEGFSMLSNVQVLANPAWRRGQTISLDETLSQHDLSREDFDVILEKPNPTRWLKWQVGKLTPKLSWNADWNELCSRFNLGHDRSYIGVHVDTQTGQYYGYEKNWPVGKWKELFETLTQSYKRKILLFGNASEQNFEGEGIVDLRGETTLLELIAIIKNHCSHLIAPDSGVLSILYYINTYFPLKTVSIWADPRQGILRQKVASPNLGFTHIPLIGKKEQVSNIEVGDVLHALFD